MTSNVLVNYFTGEEYSQKIKNLLFHMDMQHLFKKLRKIVINSPILCKKNSGISYVVLGVALNCVAIDRCREYFDNIWIQPYGIAGGSTRRSFSIEWYSEEGDQRDIDPTLIV